MPEPHYTDQEVVLRGEALYEEQIRSGIDAADHGKFLVVDVETGAYEVDRNELVAFKRARARNPDAVLYMLRIGHRTAYRLGRNLAGVMGSGVEA